MLYPQHDGVSQDYPYLSAQVRLAGSVSVAACGPERLRASQTCYCLKLPSTWKSIVPLRSCQNNNLLLQLFGRLRSRSLSQLSRQITPPTKNGHAPPPTKSWKSSQSVNPYCVWTWWVSPCWVKLSRRLHSWWCPSVNSFKFQPCNHTPPRTQKLWFLVRCRRGYYNALRSLVGIVYG